MLNPIPFPYAVSPNGNKAGSIEYRSDDVMAFCYRIVMVLNKRSLHQASVSGLEPGTCIVSNRCDHWSSDCLKLFRTSFHVDEKLWCHTLVLYGQANTAWGPSPPSPPPPPPTCIASGGTYMYARSPSPEPPYLGKKYTHPYLGYWLPLAFTTPPPPHFRVLSGNLPETKSKNTPFPEKMGTRTRLPYEFEWGEGVPGDRATCPIVCAPCRLAH